MGNSQNHQEDQRTGFSRGAGMREAGHQDHSRAHRGAADPLLLQLLSLNLDAAACPHGHWVLRSVLLSPEAESSSTRTGL